MKHTMKKALSLGAVALRPSAGGPFFVSVVPESDSDHLKNDLFIGLL